MFTFPTTSPAVSESYSRWLDEVFEPAALSIDDEALSLLEFVLAAGPGIRERMAADPVFRDQFRPAIWPAFRRCVMHDSEERQVRPAWDLFGASPHIFDLLSRRDGTGEALFQRTGLLAADLLYGPDAVLPELRDKVAGLLLTSNQELVETAFCGSWNRHPQFRRLVLERQLTDDQIFTCGRQLRAADDPEAQLARWDPLSGGALAEDIGPPPEGVRTLVPGYAIYYASRKLVQGRAVGWSDTIGVAGDAFTLATLGGGAALAKGTAKAALMAKLRKEAIEDIARLTSRELAEQAGRKEINSFVAHQALRVLPSELKTALLKSGVVDVTSLVRSGFGIAGRFGLGRESFKRITQLEAKVFMRQNAKVYVSLPSVLAGKNPCAAFLNATASNGALDAALNTGLVQSSIKTAIRYAKDENQRWQQHLACWWAGNATGAVQSLNYP